MITVYEVSNLNTARDDFVVYRGYFHKKVNGVYRYSPEKVVYVSLKGITAVSLIKKIGKESPIQNSNPIKMDSDVVLVQIGSTQATIEDGREIGKTVAICNVDTEDLTLPNGDIVSPGQSSTVIWHGTGWGYR